MDSTITLTKFVHERQDMFDKISLKIKNIENLLKKGSFDQFQYLSLRWDPYLGRLIYIDNGKPLIEQKINIRIQQKNKLETFIEKIIENQKSKENDDKQKN